MPNKQGGQNKKRGIFVKFNKQGVKINGNEGGGQNFKKSLTISNE